MPKSLMALLFFSIFLLSSCVFYQRYRLPESRLHVLKNEPMNYFLVDPSHPQTAVWYVSRAVIEDKQLSGHITRMSAQEGAEVTYIRNRNDAHWSKNDVLFYPDPTYVATLPDQGQIVLELENIEKIEVYELNQVKTFVAPLVAVLGLMILLAGLG